MIPGHTGHKKVSLPYRNIACISTGVSIEPMNDYKLCTRLNPDLSKRGLVQSQGSGQFTEGHIEINVVNCGKEIIEIQDGDLIAQCWLEPVYGFKFEEV